MRFLIIDDDLKSSLVLKRFLEEEAFAVDHATDANRGLFLTRINNYDLVIINQTRPSEFGIQLSGDLRTRGKSIPIIALLRDINPERRIDFLLAGVDDCLTQPFSLRELLARIQAVLRRGSNVKADLLKASGIILNCKTQLVRSHGKQISLSKKEFSLLELLMRHKGALVTRSVILEHVWDMKRDPFSNSLDTHICCLRKKLGPKGKRAIRNIQGRGYLIED
jgi:two-component system OmpR family response regulator